MTVENHHHLRLGSWRCSSAASRHATLWHAAAACCLSAENGAENMGLTQKNTRNMDESGGFDKGLRWCKNEELEI